MVHWRGGAIPGLELIKKDLAGDFGPFRTPAGTGQLDGRLSRELQGKTLEESLSKCGPKVDVVSSGTHEENKQIASFQQELLWARR